MVTCLLIHVVMWASVVKHLCLYLQHQLIQPTGMEIWKLFHYNITRPTKLVSCLYTHADMCAHTHACIVTILMHMYYHPLHYHSQIHDQVSGCLPVLW